MHLEIDIVFINEIFKNEQNFFVHDGVVQIKLTMDESIGSFREIKNDRFCINNERKKTNDLKLFERS